MIKGLEYIIKKRTIYIFDNVKSINDFFNENKKNIKKVVLGKNVESIGAFAFSNFSNLEEVEYNNKLQKIEDFAFNGCVKLKRADNLPDSLIYLGIGAFANSGIVSFKLPEKIEEINDRTLFGCLNLQKVELNSVVKNLKDESFYGCFKLDKLEIPKTVKSIGNSAFYGTSIKNLIFPKYLSNFGTSFCKNCKKLQNVKFLCDVKALPKMAFENALLLQKIDLPVKLNIIEENALKNCKSLTELSLPNSLNTIKDGAFNNTGLSKLNLSMKLNQCDYGVFNGCKNLTEVNIGDNYNLAFNLSVNNSIKKIEFSVLKNKIELTDFPKNMEGYNLKKVNDKKFIFVQYIVPSTKFVDYTKLFTIIEIEKNDVKKFKINEENLKEFKTYNDYFNLIHINDRPDLFLEYYNLSKKFLTMPSQNEILVLKDIKPKRYFESVNILNKLKESFKIQDEKQNTNLIKFVKATGLFYNNEKTRKTAKIFLTNLKDFKIDLLNNLVLNWNNDEESNEFCLLFMKNYEKIVNEKSFEKITLLHNNFTEISNKQKLISNIEMI